MLGLVVLARRLARTLRSLAGDPATRGLSILVLALVSFGSWFYRVVEELSWLDSTYFTVVTLTTVGYGDFVPETSAGKVFTMLYLMIGIGLIVAFVSNVAAHLIASSPRPRTSMDEVPPTH